MSKQVFSITLLLAAAASMTMAQKPAEKAPEKAPRITKKEFQALQAIQNAKSPDALSAAVDNFMTKFADSDFKSVALSSAAQVADGERDPNKAILYGQEAIKADPKNYDALLLVAGELAAHTKEFDLDKDQKLGQAEKYSRQALELIPTEPKPSYSKISDKDWEEYKKYALARAHTDLGLIAMVNKKYNDAVTEYKTAVDSMSEPDQLVMVRLVNALNEAGKPAEAIEAADKLLALPNLNGQVKQIAESEKARAVKLQASKK
jgi:tetratricopeptide (TPR) repeat protein